MNKAFVCTDSHFDAVSWRRSLMKVTIDNRILNLYTEDCSGFCIGKMSSIFTG